MISSDSWETTRLIVLPKRTATNSTIPTAASATTTETNPQRFATRANTANPTTAAPSSRKIEDASMGIPGITAYDISLGFGAESGNTSRNQWSPEFQRDISRPV
jgi:hypothetical protein